VDQLLQNRATMLAHLKENIHQAQDRMKQKADQHRSEHKFQEGEHVFLRLQPYKQTHSKTRVVRNYLQNSMDRIKYFNTSEK